MDGTELIGWLHRLRVWLDRSRRSAPFDTLRFDGPPLGDAYLTFDAASNSPAASFNENRAYLCGTQDGLSAEGPERLVRLFEDRGIKRFFVWLSPGPDASMAHDRLVAAGFSKVAWTRYPTLVARDLAERQVASDLTIREVNPEDVRQAHDALGEALWTDYVVTAGQPGFHHFMAFDGSRPVATAALALFEGVGYLAFASTEPGSRCRGAQQALIARRMKEARRLGCDLLVSETLTMLPHSMANLQRLGFVEAHEKLVYAWGA